MTPREELAQTVAALPSVRLVLALEDFRKVRKLHLELLTYFRTRFGEDAKKWPTWARDVCLPMQRVVIGSRRRLEEARRLELERTTKRNPPTSEETK